MPARHFLQLKDITREEFVHLFERTRWIKELFKPGNHGSTFGGNPLACSAALENLAIIEDDGLMQNAIDMGDLMRARLRERLTGVSGVRDIRGAGLMVGIELATPCTDLPATALEAGLLVNVTVDTVVRLLPPLIYTREHAEMAVDKLVPLITDVLSRPAAAQPAPKAA